MAGLPKECRNDEPVLPGSPPWRHQPLSHRDDDHRRATDLRRPRDAAPGERDASGSPPLTPTHAPTARSDESRHPAGGSGDPCRVRDRVRRARPDGTVEGSGAGGGEPLHRKWRTRGGGGSPPLARPRRRRWSPPASSSWVGEQGEGGLGDEHEGEPSSRWLGDVPRVRVGHYGREHRRVAVRASVRPGDEKADCSEGPSSAARGCSPAWTHTAGVGDSGPAGSRSGDRVDRGSVSSSQRQRAARHSSPRNPSRGRALNSSVRPTETAPADGGGRFCLEPLLCYNGRVKNDEARELGQELKAVLERLRALAKQERASRSSEAEALEIAIVNLDSAIEILTD